uniref:Uncharacterized protein n=1 Tax=Moniliophthora roreri TaxID=221103 RepID=A0A0W0F7Z6_MONRR
MQNFDLEKGLVN